MQSERKSSEQAQSKLEELLTCPITKEFFFHAVSIDPCGHAFEEQALETHRKVQIEKEQDQTCPTCRSLIKGVIPNTPLNGLIKKWLIYKTNVILI